MTRPSTGQLRCVVQGEEKLPADIGGESGICSAMESAALPVLQQAGIALSAVTISVHVRSLHTVSATATVNGKSLAEQHVASSDQPLAAKSIAMLADGVARELARNV